MKVEKLSVKIKNGLFDKFLGTHRKTAHTPPEKGVEKPTSEAKQNKCKKNDEAVVE